MSDDNTVSPAGETTPAPDAAVGRTPDSAPLDLDAAVSLLGPDAPREERLRAPNGRFAKADDHAGDAASAEDAGQPGEKLPSDEDEPPAGDADTPSDEDEPDADEAPNEYVDGDKKVRLRDGTETTVAELKKGREEAQDLKRQLAETEHRVRSEVTAQAQQKEQVLDQLLPIAVAALKAKLPDMPDKTLRASDPIAYMEQKEAHLEAAEELRQLEGVHAQRVAEYQQAYVKEQQQKFLSARPEMRDPAKAEAFYKEAVLPVGKEVGYTEDEIGSALLDHRLILLAELGADGLKYRALQKQKPKVVERVNAVPAQAPGRRATPTERRTSDVEALDKRLSKTGALDDALQLLNRISGTR